MGSRQAGGLLSEAVVTGGDDAPASVALGGEPLLEVLPPLASLFPGGGPRRGSTLLLTAGGSRTSLLFALLAGPLARGGWAGLLGLGGLGFEAAADLGVPLERLVVVPEPRRAWPEAAALLFDACELVVLAPPGRCSPRDARRLAARARERRSTLLVFPAGPPGLASSWPEPPDLRLACHPAAWLGLGVGHGTLGARAVEVVATGRRAAGRERRVRLFLPDAEGHVAPCPRGLPAGA